jgi:hypothetical protein
MPAGRPTLYKEEFNEQVEKLCKLGATDNEIADFFEVDVSTINNWKISHPEFFESIKKGKILADSNVADRLYQRALGFEHDGEEIKIADGEVIRVPIRKIYPPDATAAIFWLKNRRSKEWRDKQEVEQSGGITIKFENPTDYIYPSQDQSDSGIPESI